MYNLTIDPTQLALLLRLLNGGALNPQERRELFQVEEQLLAKKPVPQQRPNLTRAWINQPSTLQTHHKMHGTNVLVHDTGEEVVDVWFLKGPIQSARILRLSLSLGSWHPSKAV